MIAMEQTTLAIIAMVVAIGIIGVLVVETFVIPVLLKPQQAEARGCESVPRNISQNVTADIASKGRCFGHGPP
jgi:competence protein ComGC